MDEKWKKIVINNQETFYSVSNLGRVRNDKTKTFLGGTVNNNGYQMVHLRQRIDKYCSVHRLVMKAFCPCENQDDLEINHIDGNKLNNVLSNLEWVTCSENIKHAFKIGLKTQAGENNNASKYTEEQVLQAIELLKSKKYTCTEIDKKLGFCKDFTSSLKRKERWKYLTKDIDFT